MKNINDILPYAKHVGGEDRPIIEVDPDIFYPHYMDSIKPGLEKKRREFQGRIDAAHKDLNKASAQEKKNIQNQINVLEREKPRVPDKFDQYWLETFYQFMKMDLQKELGFAIEIRVKSTGGRKKRWALANHPEGRGIQAASRGKEARHHYKMLRGFIPG